MSRGVFAPHSAPGPCSVAVLVFIGVSFQAGRFDFSLIYRFALPPHRGRLFLVPVFGGTQNYAAGFCTAAAPPAQSILIMLIWRQYLLPLWGLRYLAVRHRTGACAKFFRARPRDRGLGSKHSSRSESAARWRFLRWR